MNAGMKMLMVDAARRGGSSGGRSGGQGGSRGGSGGRSEMEMRNEMRGGWDEMENGYGGMEMGMGDMESRRRRDSRGRFRSEMGGMEDAYGEMESRNGYGRTAMESRGGESEMRSEMRGYPNRPFPVYEGGNRMNQIGFNAGPEMTSDYRMDAGYSSGDEMQHRGGTMYQGYSSGKGGKFSKEIAEEWMRGLKNEDGTKGPHWTMEQVKQVMAQKGVQCDPVKFWAAINASYSDLAAIAKKHNVNTMDFYVDYAIAFWMKDQDAVEDKLGAYFENVVKH